MRFTRLLSAASSPRRLQSAQAASGIAIALVVLLVLAFAGYVIWLAVSQPAH